ncbi:hypothetical protein [uncultured Deefgea sp.]|nr:hypothetical protein [uncultured Deefgea sp.]
MSDEILFMLVLFAATFFPILAWLLPHKKSVFPPRSATLDADTQQRMN